MVTNYAPFCWSPSNLRSTLQWGHLFFGSSQVFSRGRAVTDGLLGSFLRELPSLSASCPTQLSCQHLNVTSWLAGTLLSGAMNNFSMCGQRDSILTSALRSSICGQPSRREPDCHASIPEYLHQCAGAESNNTCLKPDTSA